MRTLLPVLVIFSAYFAVAQDSAKPFRLPIHGYQQFEDSLRKNMVYPEDARRKGIQGTVHVHTKLDAEGQIIPETVKVISGLSLSCDSEAIRVVKKYRGKFTFFDAYDPSEAFIFPIKFVLTDLRSMFEPLQHKLPNPVKATIATKGHSQGDRNWAVFPTSLMDAQFKTVPPGDTVEILGWSTWSFFMKNEFVSGYISYKALDSSPIVDSLIDVIEEKSPIEQIEKEKNAPPKSTSNIEIISYDTAKITTMGTARFAAFTNKKSIFIGECAILTLSYQVDTDNVVPIQFYDLGVQWMKIMPSLTKGAYTFSDNIIEIVGTDRSEGDRSYTEYPIARRMYCPSAPTTITLPQFNLKMIVADLDKLPARRGKLKKFASAPINIRVNPLPEGLSLTSLGTTKMIGHFELSEEISNVRPQVDEKFEYAIMVSAHRPLVALDPPNLQVEGVDCRLVDVQDEYKFDTHVFLATRKFVYRCISRREGSLDFSGKVEYRFYDPAKATVQVLRTSKKVNVSGTKADPDQLSRSDNFFGKKLVVLVDASQSMMIEDYKPSRLDVVKEGLKKFAQRSGMCDVSIVLFSGKVIPFATGVGDSCYTSSRIDELVWDKVNSGTAIGDGIALATLSIAKGEPGRIVVIGDGDNTAGLVDAQTAAAIAKQKGFKVYSVGVGNSGLVPFGRDYFGRANMIDNTFNDRDFKAIARITGGQYVWAKDADAIANALQKFLKGN